MNRPLHLALLALLFLNQLVAQTPPAASLEIVPSEQIRVRGLTVDAPIHTNRDYRFRELPEFLLGKQAVAHAHRQPANLACKVRQPGTVWLALGEGATVAENEGIPPWRLVATMQGDDSNTRRDWRIYEARVDQGQTFTVASPNKWGAVLIARELVLPKPDPGEIHDREHRYLARLLANRPDTPRRERLAREAYHPQALVLDTDRDPLDVLLRRTRTLLDDLSRLPGAPDFATEQPQVQDLLEKAETTPVGETKTRRELFRQAAELRRRIAFQNPLLNDISRLAFLTRHKSRTGGGANHMCDQYFGFNATPGGSLYVLVNPFGPEPTLRDLLAEATVENGRLQGRKLTEGSFASLEVSFDGQTLYFAWTEAVPKIGTWLPETTYHIFRINEDGSGLRQITDGPWNDLDPCELPNGRIAFISERRGGYGRCHGRPVPTYTLHDMNPDGSDIRTLSFHETNEWHPSVGHDGMMVYTRWDYVDRDSNAGHHIWLCFPDGRDPRSYHGNYPADRSARPWMEMNIRAIPDSHRYIAVAAPHHAQAYGSLVLIDQRPDDDNAMSQVQRLTPETPFPEAETPANANLLYTTPWPLSESYWLCAFDWDGAHYGIYLADAFGNHILVHEDEEVPVLDPIPLQARPRPPVIADMTNPENAMAQVVIVNVYEADFPWPEGRTAHSLRIVQLFPKTTPAADRPRIGTGAQSLARGVLGTVPIAADGSAYFTMPAGIPVYFQVLDADGTAVQNMRSATYAQPGSILSCLGCHEPKRKAGPHSFAAPALALQGPPATIQPEFPEANPISFPRLVQPVLDRHCIACHDGGKNKIDLRGDRFVGHGWSTAYDSLRRHAWALHGGNGGIRANRGSRSLPGQLGAHGSKLYPMLRKGHGKLDLPSEDLRRITLWLDTNSNFYGAYHDPEKQARGELVLPILH